MTREPGSSCRGSSCTLVYITAPGPEKAMEISRFLVENRLAACCNVLPSMRSVYRWEGRVVEEDESVVFAKTRSDLLPALTRGVISIHPYSMPAVLGIPLTGGNPEFCGWISNETREPRGVDEDG